MTYNAGPALMPGQRRESSPMVRLFAAALAASMMLCACATPSTDGSEPREEKEYRTGSNIPVRDRSAPSEVRNVDPEALGRARSIGTRSGPAN